MSAFPDLDRWEYVVVDTETTGLRWWRDKIFGVSLTSPEGEDFYWDVRKDLRVLPWLRRKLPQAQLLVAHNAKFDWHFFREAGVHWPEKRVYCTMIAAALIDEHLLSYDLDSLGKRYCKVGKDTDIYAELAALFGGNPTKNAQAANLQHAPEELVGRYAKQDTNTTNKLFQWQRAEVDKQGLHQVLDLERRLLPVIVRLEKRGVRVDVNRAEQARDELDKLVRKMQRELNSLAGFEVNPNPSGSIAKLFQPKQNEKGDWVLVDGTIANVTDAGKASIDADCLRRMKHPAAELILKLRKYIKTRDTFISGHILSYHDNGIIHANFNQTKTESGGTDVVGTGTGRLSVTGPALQQIHKRDKDIASIVRALFVPDAGFDWVCNDWAQMDFRMFAHYVNNPTIIARYAADPYTDFHAVCSELTGLPRSPRFAGDANAKQVNLGLVFGMGEGKLAQEMGLPYFTERGEMRGEVREFLRPGPEAQEVFARYHQAIPGVREMLKRASAIAKSRGYVKTVAGRHIRFPGGQFTHKAGGLIFQGSAADALKVKLIEVDSYLESVGGDNRLLLNVHDEFDTQVEEGREDVRKEITRIVQDFDNCEISFRVPIRSDQGVGPNWWEASK